MTWRIGATGEKVTEEAQVIVMACGAIETPRLWLKSGLPNPNDWVGRGLTDHHFDTVIGVMPFDTGSSKGPGSAARADFPGYGMLENTGATPAGQASVFTFSDAGIAGFYDNGAAWRRARRGCVGRLVGAELMSAMSEVDRLLSIAVLTDDDVEAAKRGHAVHNTSPPDEHGPIPRVEIHQRNRSARTKRNREYLVEQAVRLLRAAGASKVYRINTPPWLYHIHSTMRMGLSEGDSVLDENAEARWVKRLFIADNSALANSIGGPNPTLTTQALATRTAERIFQLYFGGDPWVEEEVPVSSIDPAVTQAVMSRGLE